MCTYNGASRHLAEQLDSLFAQTQPPKEIIVQDDCSTDNTMEMLADYARRAPHGVLMRVYQNAQQQGINRNFFSAMRRATADLIAVCDQDDIWLPTKLEEQSAAIGQSMMCVCRSVPFTETGAEVRYDSRRPNCNLIRLFYASMMGHCQVLRRELLDVIPTEEECPEIYRRTCYDVMTATAAAPAPLCRGCHIRRCRRPSCAVCRQCSLHGVVRRAQLFEGEALDERPLRRSPRLPALGRTQVEDCFLGF